MHRNRLRRYVYPLAGLDDNGSRRGAFLEKVKGRRIRQGQVEYLGVWKNKDGTEDEWLEDQVVPGNLIEDYEKASRASTSSS